MSVRTLKKPVNFHTFLTYSGLFVLLCLVIFSAFFVQGKTFIWEGDGFHQHYPFFREYLTILRHFFETGEWQSWDWSIGLGADTLLTYGYYVVGDPFVYLGLLFPRGSEELAFHIIMFVRIWCVGASFLLYARKMNLSARSALAGSILYAFSHYVIYNVVRHPFFIHPMIFFPLLCLGIEKLFNKESGVLFVFIVAISAASNFYFFYMLSWMSFLYAVVRYTSVVKENNWRTFLKWLGYFVGLYLIGLLISAVIFVPQVYGFLNASRSASTPPISLLFYPLHYYGLIILNTTTPGTIYWTVGGFSVVSLLSLPFLIKRRKQIPSLFWITVILGILLLFPLFGSMMNGLSGPYNRFTFVLPFYIALATAYFIDHSHMIKETDIIWMRRLLIVFTLIYTGASVVTGDFVFYLTPVCIGWIIYGFIYARRKKRLNSVSFQRAIIGFISLNMMINALNFYLPYGKNAMSATEDYGTIDETYTNVFEGVEKNLPQDEWYRIGGSSNDNHVRNHYNYLNTPGTNSYASLTNGNLADFSRFIESSQYQIIQPTRNGIDDRRIVNQTLGVKYILTDEEFAAYLPSGYTINPTLSDEEADILVAETTHEAPFAYVETDSILLSDADTMHPVQRESLLADSVIVEEDSSLLNVREDEPPLVTHQGIWHTSDGSRIQLNEPLAITTEEENSQITLAFEEPESIVNNEIFIYFEGIDYQPPETRPGVLASTSFHLNVAYNNQEKSVLQSDKYSFSSYFKRENILIHLNEVTAAEDTLTVDFEDPGHYTFNKISVISRPYDEERAAMQSQDKNNQALIIDTFTHDFIQGSVDASEAGMLITSIPYSIGWTAYVDGEEMPTEKVNIGFIGVPVSSGEQTVEFKYQTPFLTTGFIMTGIGFLCLIGYSVIYKRYRSIQ